MSNRVNKSIAKHWCVTINNYSDELLQFLQGWGDSMPPEVSYFVFGQEVGDSGTRHLQGFVSFHKKLRITGIRKIFKTRQFYAAAMRGTPEEAATYCKKDGNYFSGGSLPKGRGSRSDLDAIAERIRNGDSQLEIATDHFAKWCQYGKRFEAYRQLLVKPRTEPPRCFYLFGSTGTGKTRAAYHFYPDLYRTPDPFLRWFDGYRGQECVLIDDFRGKKDNSQSECAFGWILQLLDRYSMQVPVKGGYVQWAPRTIIVTSNLAVEELFPDIDSAPLRRRFTRIEHFSTEFGNDFERRLSQLEWMKEVVEVEEEKEE